ncbi:MAG: hypothetical protein ACLFRB_06715 [Thiohalorhabdus sp.]|uniref:hypothetical protein n=1 Tax=Thiohalorhabdus sp. TaxID=3094134 RepID=UPI00397EBB6F
MYFYVKSEPGLWTTGHFKPDGEWEPEKDCESKEEAAERVAWLNGGAPQEIKPTLRFSSLDDALFVGVVQDEIKEARTKFPGNGRQFTALVEEVGELAEALLEHGSGSERVREEAVQVAAMAQRVAVEGDSDQIQAKTEEG